MKLLALLSITTYEKWLTNPDDLKAFTYVNQRCKV